MHNLIRIYWADVRSMFKSRSLAVLVAGLMLLPSAYAWVNIKAVWDPYNNTSGIQVAVANEDTGTSLQGKDVNIGQQTVQSLSENRKLGWTFVDRQEAKRGVEHGDYYAYMLIPADFSQKLASILEEQPQQPVIEFAVNEKLNAVTPKIATSGVTAVTSQISESFTETVAGALLSTFQAAGIELGQQLPSIQKAAAGILALEQALPQIEQMGHAAIALEKKLPELRQKANKVIALQQRVSELHQAADSMLKVQASFALVKEAGEGIMSLRDHMTNIRQAVELIARIGTQLSAIKTQIKQTIDDATAEAGAQEELPDSVKQLAALEDELAPLQDQIQSIHTDLHNKVTSLVQGMDNAASFVQDELPALEQRIAQAADFVQNGLPVLEADINQASTLIEDKLPVVESFVQKTANLARNELPSFERSIKTAADRIRRFESGDVSLEDLIAFLQHDPEAGSRFLADPIKLETKRIYPIPNYGTAMTPLYLMLALWVGGTILTTALPVEVTNPRQEYRKYQLYFGRLLTFITIGQFQALIAAAGILLLLHVQAANPASFVLSSIFISFVFVIIIFTLRSMFGQVGNGIAMILLVLQMSSSGATFPVSTTSPFFQAISPYMPFTHAISMMRETIGGMIVETVLHDILILCLYAVICFGAAELAKGSWRREVMLDIGNYTRRKPRV
ncbi:YhgE/Pip domain-containing protein [Paenibacillus xylaniclasticus]|uniref:YhgE/Pip domain-containing protein n=1 Tax=Paenibacillus xylaniclasticus TaxID=588083 RepID=UPI0013DF79CE|nr:YhgE/Pip domain-containing protein [Paenibacillus xylaniclasticus]GFN31074.1 phage infection protein [Paenibacillus curdlanolyticus]